jgi:phage shock protein A
MGIFTRFRDIVSSNINSILDRAEDPEKMVRLMIQEMEDTLIEVKSSCAGIIAEQKKIGRELEEASAAGDDWEHKAKLAVRKGREELARAALNEKRNFSRRTTILTEELERTRATVTSFQSDISQLEAKLADAREKQRTIISRRAAVRARHETQTRIRRVDTSDVFARFEAYENGIDRMEADADLINGLRSEKPTLREEFVNLEHEEEIEEELEELKKQVGDESDD